MTQIGAPEREYIAEPLESPVPEHQPAEPVKAPGEQPVETPEPEHVPA